MADNNDKLEIETEGDLDKDNNSDIGSSKESVDLEIEDVNSPNAKKKDGKTLEINLETELPKDDDATAEAIAAAVALNNQEEEPTVTPNLPEPRVELPPQIPNLESEDETRIAKNSEKQLPKQPTENETTPPTDQTKPAKLENNKPAKPTDTPTESKQVPELPESNSLTDNRSPQSESPRVENSNQPPTTKTPPTINQEAQTEPEEMPPTRTPSQKIPPKIPPQETAQPNQTINHTPPSVAKEDLSNIGPHGGAEKKIPPFGQSGIANYLVDPNKKLTRPDKSPGANETLNSPALTQPNNPINQGQQPSKISTEQQSSVAQNLEQQRALSWSEVKRIQQENYDKLEAQAKQNEAKQKKKLLSRISRQNEKLISPLEKMLLRSYFPFVTQKIIDVQEETKKLIKKEQKAKTRSGHNKISGKIGELLHLVIEPTLKISSFRDAIRRFRNFWLSWSVELWWWTVIMAIFDLIIVFPIFLFINFIFAGRSTRMLEKIKKRGYDIMELGNKLNDITMKSINERLKLSASSQQNK